MAMTRRQILLSLLLGGSWCGTELLASCGQPNPTPCQSVNAGNAPISPTGTARGAGTPGTPGGPLPTPTLMPTAEEMVILLTAPADPYHGSQIRTPETLPADGRHHRIPGR